jgi:hypothetical protein
MKLAIRIFKLHQYRYLVCIAEQAFKTAPDGRWLFYRSGPWSRPYLVPDVDDARAHWRNDYRPAVLIRVCSWGDAQTSVFRRYMAIVLAVFWIVGSVQFRDELAKLSRTIS